MSPKEHLKKNVGFLAGLIAGATGGYAAKPQTVTIPPPVDVSENGMRCTSFGDQLPDGGFVELCRPVSEPSPSPLADATTRPPEVDVVVVSFVTDGKGRITHRCEQASTGGDVCVPVDADGGR